MRTEIQETYRKHLAKILTPQDAEYWLLSWEDFIKGRDKVIADKENGTRLMSVVRGEASLRAIDDQLKPYIREAFRNRRNLVYGSAEYEDNEKLIVELMGYL